MFSNMNGIIIEQLIEESVSSANKVAAGMQDNHPKKRVRFVDEVEMTKEKMIIGSNSKSRMYNVDGQSFYPFFKNLDWRLWSLPFHHK